MTATASSLRRIAVVHNLPPGGAKRCLYELLRAMRGRYEIELFQLQSPYATFLPLEPFADRVHDVPVPVRPPGSGGVLRAAGDFRFYLQLQAAWRSIAAAVNAGGFDLAFIHHCRFTQSPLVVPRLRVPTVYFCQEPPRALYEPPIRRVGDDRAARHGWLRYLKDTVVRRWDRANVAASTVIEVNSHYSSEVIYRTYGRDAVVCLLGVDPGTFHPLRLARERMVLTVGSLSPTKSHDLVIAAAALLPEGRRPRVVLAGPVREEDAVERDYLTRFARERGVGFDIVAFPDDRTLCELYNRATATIFVPRLEPFGFVALESQACGTPVVGIAEGGVRETVRDGVTGILCDRSADSCAAAMERLLDDPALVERLGRAGTEAARRDWTWTRTLASVERGFAAALQAWRDRGGGAAAERNPPAALPR